MGFRHARRRLDLGSGVSTAVTWYRRYRETGEVSARKQGQPGGSKLDAHAAFILALVRERPDISLAEIAERLAEETGRVGLSGDDLVFL